MVVWSHGGTTIDKPGCGSFYPRASCQNRAYFRKLELLNIIESNALYKAIAKMLKL